MKCHRGKVGLGHDVLLQVVFGMVAKLCLKENIFKRRFGRSVFSKPFKPDRVVRYFVYIMYLQVVMCYPSAFSASGL